jgi:hypothetical protein
MPDYVGKAQTDLTPGTLLAYQPDGASNSPTILKMNGDAWPRCYAAHAGLLYCPQLDCFFLYSQRASTPYAYKANEIFQITPPASQPLTNPWVVQRIMMGGDAVVADPQGIGNYKRFMWVPALKSIAILNRWDSHVYLFKPRGL